MPNDTKETIRQWWFHKKQKVIKNLLSVKVTLQDFLIW